VLSAEVVDLGWWCCIFLGGWLGCYMHVRVIMKMLIQDQVTVFQWLLYIKYGGPRLVR
jgi:hypothetical protein